MLQTGMLMYVALHLSAIQRLYVRSRIKALQHYHMTILGKKLRLKLKKGFNTLLLIIITEICVAYELISLICSF